jgi:hypothetical protein
VEDVTDPRGVCAKRAEGFTPAVPYVRGWAHAKRGATALAEVLRALGLDSDFPGLKADVNVNGDGIVCLGSVRPEAVKLLAAALTEGLLREIGEQERTGRERNLETRSERETHAK